MESKKLRFSSWYQHRLAHIPEHAHPQSWGLVEKSDQHTSKNADYQVSLLDGSQNKAISFHSDQDSWCLSSACKKTVMFLKRHKQIPSNVVHTNQFAELETARHMLPSGCSGRGRRVRLKRPSGIITPMGEPGVGILAV